MYVDFHTHTLASDGDLSPTALVQRAAAQGVECLAITDHDTCAGLAEGRTAAAEAGIGFINGIEFSSVWKGMNIHVVGLRFDSEHPVMQSAVEQQAHARRQRAQLIGERLAKQQMPGVYPQAEQIAGRADVGRPHFARAMVQLGYVNAEQQAFEQYLGTGKLGDVKTHWPELASVVEWITQAGGVAVLAHPGKYKMTWSKLRALMEHFKDAGGQAVEISYGSENPDRLAEIARITARMELKASVGSDFHSPRRQWTEVGKYPRPRVDVAPVWADWF